MAKIGLWDKVGFVWFSDEAESPSSTAAAGSFVILHQEVIKFSALLAPPARFAVIVSVTTKRRKIPPLHPMLNKLLLK